MPSEVTQTPAQKQAAAKLALRKQLEKTLLQIPPPKPPPPEMHFIPNANNSEFIYYFGLETIVDFLTDSPNQNKPPPEPFECVQCGVDFTPVWKWQDSLDLKRNRPAVICETCVTSNIKKALKAEHTNRLKTAFVKALQQEQEIEQRIASGAPSPPLPASVTPPNPSSFSNQVQSNPNNHLGSTPVMPQAPPAHSSFPRSSANAAAAAAQLANSAALLQKMPNFSAAHQSLIQAQLQQLAQSLPQPQPAHLLSFAPLLYQYGAMLGKSGAVPSDLHRQYLLDMIPPRSMAQNSGLNWKT
jgi:PREDICTED: similar to simjang CG32067-PC, isoform C